MGNKSIENAFFTLVRLGIGSASGLLPESIDWQELKDLAERQGLGAVMLDGVEKLPEGQRPPKVFLLEWIGETLQGYEYRFELYQRAIAELAGFYNSHGFKMMVLKGYACSINWPKPEHRPCGDIDIWLFGNQKEADSVLAIEKGIVIDTGHHRHTGFSWRDFIVENHYDFLNIHHHRSNVEFEKILKQLGREDTFSTELLGERVFVPSPNLHALFLLKHIMNHFASENITFRQVLDWGFFVKANYEKVDWRWIESVMCRFRMDRMYGILNSICSVELGFDDELFNSTQADPLMKGKVISEILHPKFSNKLPHYLVSRIFYKLYRWRANKWKHQLCYRDSMWSAFWSGVLNHLQKPSTI